MSSGMHQWSALGTYAQIAVDGPEATADAARIARRVVDEVDMTCSRFRSDSDLSRANANAGQWQRVHPLLVQAVEAALHAARMTDGLVDPTLGRHLVDLGYDRDLRLVRRQPAVQPSALPSEGGDHVSSRAVPVSPLIGAWRDVRTDPAGWLFVPEGSALDLGATGKAFAADLVAQAVSRELGCSVIVSLGGDVASVTLRAHRGWQVLVSDTEGGDLDAPGQVVVLTTGGLATSSTRHRRWSHQGRQLHHILDPRTGQPADEVVVSATVCASSCLEANAASTAAIILGAEAASWLSYRDISALLVGRDGNVARLADWPSAQEVATAC